ncbi:hypothetical protein GGF49_001193 [Coemansia sp. RSA 1853]|nr:hypothetical protein GGF49_001193 [Coemansia sp. RSA 1853]
MYKLTFFLVVLTHAHALTVAQYFLTVFTDIVSYFANMTSAHVPAEVVIGLQQRLDAQAEKCKELQYLIAQQESKIASMSESHRELQWSFDRDSGYIIKYMRALACKERKLGKLNEKLFAVNDDCDNKIKEIASLKYNEEQYQEEIEDLRAELALRAE